MLLYVKAALEAEIGHHEPFRRVISFPLRAHSLFTIRAAPQTIVPFPAALSSSTQLPVERERNLTLSGMSAWGRLTD